MPCKSCAARRRLLAAGYAKGGIKGAVKAMPAVGRHLVANPPRLERKPDDAPDVGRR
ncbi:MAG: hypothetical protein OSB00_19810 [Sphingomonas bacterium]|nr:hypothetical protein [Sphingomonas bacterium]